MCIFIKKRKNMKIRKMRMIDIHTHLLFGVDDGPKTMEESVEMLKFAK